MLFVAHQTLLSGPGRTHFLAPLRGGCILGLVRPVGQERSLLAWSSLADGRPSFCQGTSSEGGRLALQQPGSLSDGGPRQSPQPARDGQTTSALPFYTTEILRCLVIPACPHRYVPHPQSKKEEKKAFSPLRLGLASKRALAPGTTPRRVLCFRGSQAICQTPSGGFRLSSATYELGDPGQAA